MRLTTGQSAVIADRYPVWRNALANLLKQLDLTVVGLASSADEAAAMVGEYRPDVLVADAELAVGNGSSLFERARTACPDVRCIVLFERGGEGEREAAFAAGASASCAKHAEPEELAAAIRQSFSRSIYFADAQIVGADPPVVVRAPESSPLTKRETEILRLTTEGHSNSELARMLWVTEQTIKFHLSNIYRKLGVSNRTEASHWALAHGLLYGYSTGSDKREHAAAA